MRYINLRLTYLLTYFTGRFWGAVLTRHSLYVADPRVDLRWEQTQLRSSCLLMQVPNPPPRPYITAVARSSYSMQICRYDKVGEQAMNDSGPLTDWWVRCVGSVVCDPPSHHPLVGRHVWGWTRYQIGGKFNVGICICSVCRPISRTHLVKTIACVMYANPIT